MKRLFVLAMLAAAALASGCSGHVIRAESGDKEIDAASPLLRESLTLGLLVMVIVVVLAVVVWRLLRNRSR